MPVIILRLVIGWVFILASLVLIPFACWPWKYPEEELKGAIFFVAMFVSFATGAVLLACHFP